MAVRAIENLLKKYCDAVSIDHSVSVHSMRVTAATEANRASVPLNEIQLWLGHKDPRTTMKYIRTEELPRQFLLQVRRPSEEGTKATFAGFATDRFTLLSQLMPVAIDFKQASRNEFLKQFRRG